MKYLDISFGLDDTVFMKRNARRDGMSAGNWFYGSPGFHSGLSRGFAISEPAKPTPNQIEETKMLTPKTLTTRQAQERAIALIVVEDAISAGYTVTVCDGEAVVVRRSQDQAAIVAAMFTTEEDVLTLRTLAGANVGMIQFIYGNGADVIADCTDTEAVNTVLKRANELAELFDAEEIMADSAISNGQTAKAKLAGTQQRCKRCNELLFDLASECFELCPTCRKVGQ